MGDGSSTRYDSKGKGKATPNGDMLALDLEHVEDGGGGQNGGAFMQMQLVEQQVISSIQSSLSPLILCMSPGQLHPV